MNNAFHVPPSSFPSPLHTHHTCTPHPHCDPIFSTRNKHSKPCVHPIDHPYPHQVETCTESAEGDTQLAVNDQSWGPLGPGSSRYCPRYMTNEFEEKLLKWCRDEVVFQIYQCTSLTMVLGGVPRFKAPKAEFYLLDAEGRRPHYKWIQLNVFNHVGQQMPPILRMLCEKLNIDFGLEGDDRFNHCLIICNEQSGTGTDAHCAPPHADKIQKGFFVDLSLGYTRPMQLIDVNSEAVVASQPLASGSAAYISAEDNGHLVQGIQKRKGDPKVENGRYMHAVPVDPDQPIDQPRFSLVFRPITDHPKGQKRGEHLAPVDEEQAARVRPGGDLFRPYNPLCRGGQGFREFL